MSTSTCWRSNRISPPGSSSSTSDHFLLFRSLIPLWSLCLPLAVRLVRLRPHPPGFDKSTAASMQPDLLEVMRMREGQLITWEPLRYQRRLRAGTQSAASAPSLWATDISTDKDTVAYFPPKLTWNWHPLPLHDSPFKIKAYNVHKVALRCAGVFIEWCKSTSDGTLVKSAKQWSQPQRRRLRNRIWPLGSAFVYC